MENHSLKKRLYQNLGQKSNKHNFLLQNDSGTHGNNILKPKIHHESATQNRNSPKQIMPGMKNLLKSKENQQKKKEKPKQLPVEKLSQEAKTLLQENKVRSKKNLKPHQIFAFYEAFPEMIEDFFYLNRVSHPYDYEIVTYAKRNPIEYMTISSQGVTLYHDKQAQFLSKEEWLADQKIYYKLQKIDFFSQYKLSKNFTIWKNRMKRHYMKSISNILSQKIFLTSKHPRNCLTEIRYLCLNLQESILPIDNNELKWQQLLKSSQDILLKNVMNKFNQIQKQIIKKLESAIDQEIKNFKQNNKIKIQGLKTNENKEENKEGYVYSQQAILRKQYKRVVKLIKLADGIFLQSKINLIKRWMVLLIEKLRQINEGSMKDEWITIIFTAVPPLSFQPASKDSNITWNPSKQDFISTFKIIISKAVELIANKHKKLITQEAFEKYRNSEEQISQKQDKYNNLRNLIQQSLFYKMMLQQIQYALYNHYEDVIDIEKTLSNILKIYQSHKNKPKIENIIEQSSVAELRQFVRDWQSHNKQMCELPDKGCGMIKFDFSRIRKQMTTVAADSLNELFKLLPTYLNRLCQETQSKTRILLKSIDILPNDANFPEFTKAARNAQEQLKDIVEKDRIIRQLRNLAEQKIKVYKNNTNSVQTVVSQLKNKVEQANSMFEKRIKKFKKDIDATIEKTKNTLKQLNSKFEKVEAQQNQNQIEGTLLQINNILPKITQVDKQANHLINIQYQLGLPVTNFESANQLSNKVNNLQDLWLCKKQWKQYIRGLYPTHYKKIDCNLLLNTWMSFNGRVQKIKQNGEQSQFVTILGDKMDEFQNLIGLIKALQSKSLDQKSWKQIAEYLAYQMDKKDQSTPEEDYPLSNPDDQKYTMEWLISNGACFFKEKIQFIVNKSQKEAYIITLHQILKNYINSISLQFVTKKREVMVLAKNQQTFKQLNNHLESLLNIFDYQYSQQIKKDTKDLAKFYEYVIEILESLRIFQAQWQKYGDLFDPQRHFSKQLSKQAKQFSSWQTQWKKIIKTINIDSSWPKYEEDTKGISETKSINLLKSINKANIPLESIKKGIQQFLDRRRSIFPHYFYLNDQQLLHIVKKSDQIQQFSTQIVPMIYENISSIKYEKQSDAFVSVCSKDGEELKFGKVSTSKIVSDTQEIFKNCQDSWKRSLIIAIRNAFNYYISSNETHNSRQKIILENITQVVLAFEHIVWVRLAQETYLSQQPLGTFDNWIQIQNDQIIQAKNILLAQNQKISTKKLQKYILQAIYLREKTQQFRRMGINSLHSYQWERTPKLYDLTGLGNSTMHEKIEIKIFGSSVNYGGQFIGCTGRYYLTPETQKSYIHLAQSIYQKKVSLIPNYLCKQTIKDFAHLIAQPFKEFYLQKKCENKMIDKIFAGACAQNIWLLISANQQDKQLLSVLSTQISHVMKCLTDSTNFAQIGKYNIPLNQSAPSFFIRCQNEAKYEGFSSQLKKDTFRTINLMKPDMNKILSIISKELNNNEQLCDKISQIMKYIKDMFDEDLYLKIDDKLTENVFNELRQASQKGRNLDKKICQILKRKLLPYLKPQDQDLLINFIESYNSNADDFKLKTKKKINSTNNLKIEELYEKYTMDMNIQNEKMLQNCYRLCSIYENTQNDKKIVIVGNCLSGKTQILQYARNILSKKTNRQIQSQNIYFNGVKPELLFQNSEKKKSIIEKSIKFSQNLQTWLVFDGNINQNYQKYCCTLGQQISTKVNSHINYLRIFCETTTVKDLTPAFLQNHSFMYINEEQSNFTQIIKNMIYKPLYIDFQKRSKQIIKNDKLEPLKYLQKCQKKVTLQQETVQYLATQVNSLINRITHKGVLRIKQVQWMYTIRACQLAYKCSKLIQSIFKMNWQTIKEKQKGSIKKVIQRFAIWVVVWVLKSLAKPEDMQKLQKQLTQMFKLSSLDEFVKGAVYPGFGLQIYSTKSQRGQSSLPNISAKGVPTNILTFNNLVFDFHSVKNKFYEQIYLDQPLCVRVNTDESIRFSYQCMLGQYSDTKMLISGPNGTGKRSIVDLYIKNCQQKLESYILRQKKHNQYYLNTQILTLFSKLYGTHKSYLKPSNISKKIHVCIEDVHLSPKYEITSEFLRMIINQNGTYQQKGEWMNFRQFYMSLVLNQYRQHNIQKIGFNRILSKLGIFQTSQNSQQKLFSIFSPIIQTWGSSIWSQQNSDSHVFTSRNGDSIVNSTLNIFSLVNQIASNIPCNIINNRNQRLLLKPKIQDICFVFSGICQSQGHIQNLKISKYYSQFWAHEIIRVFGDKIRSSQHRKTVIDQIKKESLLKFKEHFNYPESFFIFTNFNNSQDQSITRCYDIQEVYKTIQNIHENLNTNLASPIWFDQLVEEMIKIYRIIQQPYGHLAVISPYSNGNKSLLKLTCLLKDYAFNQIQDNINGDAHILPIILNQMNSCFFVNPFSISEQCIYQIDCLMNKNMYQHSLSAQSMEKIKSKMLHIAQQKMPKDLDNLNTSTYTNNKTRYLAEIKSSMQNKIKQHLDSLISQQFIQRAHFVFPVKIDCAKVTSFLRDCRSIMKHTQILWFEFTDQTIVTVSESMIEQVSDEKKDKKAYKNIYENCKKLYEKVDAEQKSYLEFMKLLKNASTLMQQSSERIQKKKNQCQGCIKKRKLYLQKMEDSKKSLECNHRQIDQLMEQQQILNKQLDNKEIQQSKKTQLQDQLKKIKLKKQAFQQKFRQARIQMNNMEDLIQFYQPQNVINTQLQDLQKQLKSCELDCVIVAAVFLFLNHQNQQQHLQQINLWRQTLSQQPIQNHVQLLNIFQKFFDKHSVLVPGWENYSPFLKVKGIQFCENMKGILKNSSKQQEEQYFIDSAFSGQTLVVDDCDGLLIQLLQARALNETDNKNNNESNILNIIQKIPNKQKTNKKDIEEPMKLEQQKSFKLEALIKIDRAIQKYRNGLIIVGNSQNQNEQLKRTDLLLFQRSLNHRKMELGGRVILYSQNKPNFKFHTDPFLLKTKLQQHSLKIQFSHQVLAQKKKTLTALTKSSFLIHQRKQQLLELCASEQQPQTILQRAKKIKEQISNYSEFQRKKQLILKEDRFTARDKFLIQWIQSILPGSTKKIEPVLQIYQFIKRCFMQLKVTNQMQYSTMQQIPQQVKVYWENTIKANLNPSKMLDLKSIIKYSVPLCQKDHLIVIKMEQGALQMIQKNIEDDNLYSVNKINLLNCSFSLQSDQNISEVFKKKLNIYLNYYPTCQNLLIELVQKNKNNAYTVNIVLARQPESLVNEENIQKQFWVQVYKLKVKKQTLLQKLNSVTMEQQNQSRQQLNISNVLCQNKTIKKNSIIDDAQNLTQMIKQNLSIQAKKKSIEALKTAIIFQLVSYRSKQNYKAYQASLSLKEISKYLKYLDDVDKTQKILGDFIVDGDTQRMQAICYICKSVLKDNLSLQMNRLMCQYLQKLESPILKTENNWIEKYVLVSNPQISDIKQIIQGLPFAFNLLEIDEPSQPLGRQFVKRAKQFNYNRSNLKKYLQETLKFVKGQYVLNFGEQFQQKVPTKKYIQELSSEYHAIKKGLQAVGLASVDVIGSCLKLSSQPHQTQSLASIASYGYDTNCLPNISSKFIMMIRIRASKKLKISCRDLKCHWFIFQKHKVIEEPITNPELSVMFTAEAKFIQNLSMPINISSQKCKNKKMKIIMIPYDPQTAANALNQALKQTNKKQRNCKNGRKIRNEKKQSHASNYPLQNLQLKCCVNFYSSLTASKVLGTSQIPLSEKAVNNLDQNQSLQKLMSTRIQKPVFNIL